MKMVTQYRWKVDGVEGAISQSERNYRDTTDKQRTIEGTLAERLGYVPMRIDDRLLISWQKKVDDYKNRRKKAEENPSREISFN